MWGPQVLKDYQSPVGEPVSELSGDQRLAARQVAEFDLRAAFERDITKAEKRQRDATLEAAGLGCVARRHNRDWILKIDNQLRQGAGFALAAFEPNRRSTALKRGEERYFTCTDDSKQGTAEVWSCLRLPDGSRVFECPRLKVGVAHLTLVARPGVHRICGGDVDGPRQALPHDASVRPSTPSPQRLGGLGGRFRARHHKAGFSPGRGWHRLRRLPLGFEGQPPASCQQVCITSASRGCALGAPCLRSPGPLPGILRAPLAKLGDQQESSCAPLQCCD